MKEEGYYRLYGRNGRDGSIDWWSGNQRRLSNGVVIGDPVQARADQLLLTYGHHIEYVVFWASPDEANSFGGFEQQYEFAKKNGRPIKWTAPAAAADLPTDKEVMPFEVDYQHLSADGRFLYNDAPCDPNVAWKATKLACGDSS